MNSLMITGHLGRDAETRYLPDGTPVLSFSVADNQGGDKPPIWWRCSVFGKRAESLAPHMVKGTSVTVVGNVIERDYTAQDGTPKKSQDVRVSNVDLHGGGRQSDDQQAPPERQAPAPRAPAPAPRTQAPASRPAPRPPASQGGSGFDDFEDSIPF